MKLLKDQFDGKTKKSQEGCMLFLVFIGAVFTYCIASKIWNVDLGIPLEYSGDVSGLLINLNSVLRDEKWWSFDALGAPFGTNMWRQMWDAIIPNMIIFTLTKVTNSVGYGINLYFIMSFGLSAMCMYYMLRRCNIKRSYSIVGAIIYALIPGHIQRGESHIYVGSCFCIPLVLVAGFDLYDGKTCDEKYINQEKLRLGELFRCSSKRQKQGLLFFAIVSLSTIYYGIFALMYLTFCTFVCVMRTKKFRYFYHYIQYWIVEALVILLVYFPQVIANKYDPLVENVNIVTRTLGDVELYAGKFIQYILPIRGHRVGIFARIRELYDTSFSVNENGMASLGLVMSIGLLIGLAVCFCNNSRFSKSVLKYGKIEMFFLLVSTVGGLGALVGMFNYSIRCYNRFSYFIGAVGMVIFVVLMQMLEKHIATNLPKVGKFAPYVIPLILLIVAIWDQTTEAMVYSKEVGEIKKVQYLNDKNFVESIEKYEGEDADILVFPIMDGQQSTIAITDEGVCTAYNEQMLFVHSSTSNWSIGSKPGEKGERWKKWMQNYSVERQIEIASIAGFEGIAVFINGYTVDKQNSVLGMLSEKLGEPIISNKNGTWVYYSLEKMKESNLLTYSDVEIINLQKRYVEDFDKWVEFDKDTLFTTSGEMDGDAILLSEDTCQYGPFSAFKCGVYEVKIDGDGLDKAEFDCVNSGTNHPIEIIEHTSNCIKYQVLFETDVSDVEFRVFNASSIDRIKINSIMVTKIEE